MTTERSDEPPVIRKLNFGHFHDLMHVPFTRECRKLSGGPRRHVRLWLEYLGWPAVRVQTVCRIGRHRSVVWTQIGGGDDDGNEELRCRDCARSLEHGRPLPFSRPCYDKMLRCPGWAGGGTRSARVYRCENGFLAGDVYGRPYWMVRFNRCTTCRLLVLPYVVRYVDPGYWRWCVRDARDRLKDRWLDIREDQRWRRDGR